MTSSATRDPRPARDVAGSARSRARSVAVVDGAGDRATVLAAIGRELSVPDWYGGNLDALEELLRDLSWLPDGPVELVWADGPLRAADPRTHGTVLEILDGAVAAHAGGDRPLAVVLAGPEN